MVKHLLDKFHIITVVSNPVRFESRWKLFREFEARIKKFGVNLITVELQQGDRAFQVTEHGNENHLQFRTFHELWHKENMINRGIHHLTRVHPNWEYVAWIDADVIFMRDDIIHETIHQLQHHMVVQMWETGINLGPKGEAIDTHYSFISQYVKGKKYCYGTKGKYYVGWHPGFAWAARREAIDGMGGLSGPLIDTAILGAGDNHMAHALVGKLDVTMSLNLQCNYHRHLATWQKRVERTIRRDVGFVHGTLLHYWHGKIKDRRYHDRWKILVDNKYDPDIDLERDSQGLYQLADHGTLRSIKLRDDIRNYFRARSEDSIDL